MINYKINDRNKYLPAEGGTLSGDLNMGGRLIKNVASPVDGSDSITKKYVEDNFATQEDFSAIGILLSLNNIVLLKVVNCNGVPAYGVTASGIKDANGNDVVIGQDGLVNGVCTGTTVTFKATEMADYTYDISSIKGSSQRTTVTLPSIENRIIRYNTTTTIKFSGITGKVDVCCVGGGGGGSCSLYLMSTTPTHYYGGAGGGGGNIVNAYNISIQPKAPYTLTIGAGGLGATAGQLSSAYYPGIITLEDGKSGGTTSAFGVSATGGGGGTGPRTTQNDGAGTGYGGTGGSSTNGGAGGSWDSPTGKNATGTEFSDGKTYYSGGGGSQGSGSGGGAGGTPYGASATGNGKGVSSTGAGGGGGAGDYSSTSGQRQAGDGYKGLVAIRLHDATL